MRQDELADELAVGAPSHNHVDRNDHNALTHFPDQNGMVAFLCAPLESITPEIFRVGHTVERDTYEGSQSNTFGTNFPFTQSTMFCDFGPQTQLPSTMVLASNVTLGAEATYPFQFPSSNGGLFHQDPTSSWFMSPDPTYCFPPLQPCSGQVFNMGPDANSPRGH